MSETMTYTDADFDQLSWHDNYIYGFHILIGDFEHGDWRSDWVVDIDYILEWVCGTDQRCQFRVAPATLTFHDVTDLKIAIDWGRSGFQTAIHEISISHIIRSQIDEQKICLDRPYYSWEIHTNFPKEGRITFGSSCFTQVLHAESLLIDEQKLSPSQRTPLFPPCG